MLKLKKVAITGALCSGKSQVCDFLEKQGAYLVSADKIVHQLLSSNTDCIEKIIKLFGSDVISNKQIDRKKVATKVFSDSEKLLRLEQILHPEVLKELTKHYEKAISSYPSKLFIAEIPLLYEAGWEGFFDKVVLVIAEEKLCQQRYLDQGGNLEDFKWRKKRLMDEKKKEHLADFIILNNGKLSELKQQVLRIYPKLLD